MALGFGTGAVLGLPQLLELSIAATWLVAGSAVLLGAVGFFVGSRESHLVAACTHDPKTRLAKRDAFLERLSQEFDRAARHHAPLAVLLIDVEPEGGDAIQRLAALLRATCRSMDLVAHHQPRQLAVLAPDTSAAQAGLFAERMLDAMQGAEGSTLSATIGVAQFRTTTMRDPQALLEAAAQAALIAKLSGRDVVVLDGGAAKDTSTPQQRWKMPSDRDPERGDQPQRHGAAIRANEIVDADGHTQTELSVFCGECETWQPR